MTNKFYGIGKNVWLAQTLEQKHKFLKDNPKERSHAFSLAYAKKEVKECKERIELAIKLWGN